MTTMSIFLILYLFLAFLSGCGLLIHFRYIFHNFNGKSFRLFSNIILVLTVIHFFLLCFVLCQYLTPPLFIPSLLLSKLFLLLIPLCVSFLILPSLKFNFEVFGPNISYQRPIRWCLAISNTIGAILIAYYFFNNSFQLWPFLLILFTNSCFIFIVC